MEEKGLITAAQYKEDYTLLALCEFTNGTGWDGFNSLSLSGIITNILNYSSKDKVFEFDSFKELSEWLCS